MHLRIHHIFIVFAAALWSGGCTRQPLPERDGGEIRFGAGALQLEETKSSFYPLNTLDQRTSFNPNDEISVYAWHQNEGQKVFDNKTVTCVDPAVDNWTYTEKKKWSWHDNDYYDFLAVTKKVGGTALAPGSVTTIAPTSGNTFALSVPYDPRTDHYDLMMAGTRRRVTDADPSSVVRLDFRHMLSAVRVVFHRDSGSQKYVVTSYGFSDLIVAANIVWGWDETDKVCKVSLDDTEHSHQVHFGFDRESDAPWLDGDKFLPADYNPGNYDSADHYDLLIPQNLDSTDSPSLVVKFHDDVNGAWNLYEPDPIPLKDIKVKNTDTPITAWEPGKVYTYEVHILLNGGVLVNVITTEWDEVEAQTPGLMI